MTDTADQWETITPQRGQRATTARGVSVSWRRPHGAASFHMCITVSEPVAQELGWKGKDRIVIQRNTAAGLLRASLKDCAESYALHGSKTGGVVAAYFAYPGLPLTERQTARLVPHRIEDGALVLTLPDWARLNAARPAPAPSRAAPPPDPRAELEEEAARLFRLRQSVAQVARTVKLPLADLVRIEQRARAEREGAAA